MIQWFKKLSTSEKIMLWLMLMLLIGIVSRWQYIKQEGGESIKNRLNIEKPATAADSVKLSE